MKVSRNPTARYVDLVDVVDPINYIRTRDLTAGSSAGALLLIDRLPANLLLVSLVYRALSLPRSLSLSVVVRPSLSSSMSPHTGSSSSSKQNALGQPLAVLLAHRELHDVLLEAAHRLALRRRSKNLKTIRSARSTKKSGRLFFAPRRPSRPRQ